MSPEDQSARRYATASSFRVRGTHPIPAELPEPPAAWHDDYAALITDLTIGARTVDAAMATVRPVWDANLRELDS